MRVDAKEEFQRVSRFMTKVRNDLFDATLGFDRGRGVVAMGLWQVVKWAFFMTVFPWPSAVKVFWLRVFGAKVGKGVCIKPRVNVHLPWKLVVGDFAWIGEEAFLLNFERMEIGAHACISQRAFLCGGNHDYRDVAMRYRNGEIRVGAGAWVGAQVFVGPGVKIGEECVVLAGSVVTKDLPGGMVCGVTNSAQKTKERWRSMYRV